MAEIKTNDIQEVKNPSAENYKQIVPEKGTIMQEAKDFWHKYFDSESKTSALDTKKEKEYYDDNGNLYRTGDHLEPNTRFEINGYYYETDRKGRIVCAEGKLHMGDSESALNMEDVKSKKGQDYKESDDRGHLIGHRFGGSDKLENLVPMDAKLNQGDFKKVENKLAAAVKSGDDVRLKVEPVYKGDSNRPTEFRVSYSISVDKEIVVFKNGSGGKNNA